MDTILDKCIKGDKDAFIKVINSMERKLYIIAKSRVDNEEDVKDIIQDTIYSCFKNIKKLKDKNKFESWIVTILINNCNLFYKNKKNIVIVPFDEQYTSNLKDDNNFKSLNDNIDFFHLVNLLDNDEKTIFCLFYVNEYTTSKISEILNMNENTIKSKLKRSREKIKEHLERWD